MKSNPYESEQYLSEYLLFHYGRPHELCPLRFVPKETLRFHERIRKECLLPVRHLKPQPIGAQPSSGPAITRGLDLGCGVGRFAFELGLVVDEVLGVDNSKRFIAAGRRMAKRHTLTAHVRESGAQFKKTEFTLPKGLQRTSVRFQVGDAMELRRFADNSFDAVAAINLICRLPNPANFLRQIHRIVKPAGQLVLASPFSWHGSYTPPREWLDAAQVARALAPHFELSRRRDMPFVIREHQRKYQLVVSEVLTFVRR